MEHNSLKKNNDKLFNYFSNIKNNQDTRLYRKLELKLVDHDSSFVHNSRNKYQVKHLSVEKYLQNKSCKSNNNKTYSIDMTTNKTFTDKNLSVKNGRRITEYIHSHFNKLDDTKISRLSKSPLNLNKINNSSLVSYMKNSKNIKHTSIFDNLCKTTQNKSQQLKSETGGNNKQTNTNNNISSNNSKYCSLNTSFVYKNGNGTGNAKDVKTPNEINTSNFKGDEEITDTCREKINVLYVI